MRPTTWRTLLAPALLAGVLGWFFARMLENRRGEVGVPPWSAALVLTAAGIALIYTARHTRARLEGRQGTKPVPPLVAARLAALGVAGSRAGALVAGAYLGYTAYVATDLSTDFRQGVFIRGLACAAGAVVLVVGSLLLERTLRLPEPTPDEDPERRDFAG